MRDDPHHTHKYEVDHYPLFELKLWMHPLYFCYLRFSWAGVDAFSIRHDRGLLRKHVSLSSLMAYPSGHVHFSEPSTITHVGGHGWPGTQLFSMATNKRDHTTSVFKENTSHQFDNDVFMPKMKQASRHSEPSASYYINFLWIQIGM